MADWIPEGRSALSPFLMVQNADKVVDFAVAAFDAVLPHPPLRRSDGRIWNAELRIADGSILLSDGGPGMSRPGFLHLYVEDADAAFQRALSAGADLMMPLEEQFYGEYAGGVTDPCGNIWWIATMTQRMSQEELETAARAKEAQMGG